VELKTSGRLEADLEATINDGGKFTIFDSGVAVIDGPFKNESGGIVDVKRGGTVESPNATNQGTFYSDGKDIGEFRNEAILVIGGQEPKIGRFLIEGDFEQIAGADLKIEIDGTTPETEHDVLKVVGDATMGGALDASIGGYLPAVWDGAGRGDFFAVVTATTSLSGEFDVDPELTLPDPEDELGLLPSSPYKQLEWRVIYDTGDPDDIPGGREIARREILVDTPSDPFIFLQAGYQWPAGSTVLYQLRQHEPNTRYDIYWVADGTGASTKILANTNQPTDSQGRLWLDYTIPIDAESGLYRLQSKLGLADGGGSASPVSGIILQPVEVVEQPYLRIAAGNLQMPGATIRLELGNHAANAGYDLYLFVNEDNIIKIPGSPIFTDAAGNGRLIFSVPTNLAIGNRYALRSYPEDRSPYGEAPVAETTLTLAAPDIQVTAIDLPEAPAFNTPMPVTVTLSNMSGVTITDRTFDLDLYIDPLLPPNQSRPFPPGQVKLWLESPFPRQSTRTIATQITLDSPFGQTIWARADTSNRVVETDELNNLLAVPVAPSACQIELSGANFSLDNTIAFGDADDPADPPTLSVSGETINLTNKGSGGSGFSDDDFGYFFAYHHLTRDFDVQVRAISQSGDDALDDYAYFGLEVRAGLEPESAKIQWVASKGQSLGYQQRQLNYRAPLDGEFGIGPNDRPVWLRIIKIRSELILYYALDETGPPTAWVKYKTLTAPELAGTVYVGLMNTPLDNGQANTVTFDSFHICGRAAGTCGPVQEGQGLVVLNATNFTANVADSNDDDDLNGLTWAVTVRDDLSGMVVPKQSPPVQIGNDDQVEKAARLDYEVHVSNSGTYYAWLLAARPADDDQDNSLYFGLRDEPPDQGHFWRTQETAGQIEWFNDVVNGGVNQVALQAGRNRLSLWMHKDGFELYQILLTQDASFDPTGLGAFNQSGCLNLSLPPSPPGLQQCQAAIVNGDFENDALMSKWIYPGVSQQVTRTSVPHYFGPNQSFGMVLPDTRIGGIPREPWIYQAFTVPSWITTPTNNVGPTMNLKLHVGVNPEGSPEPDELFVTLRDQTGSFTVTIPVTVATGADQPALVPPVSSNNGWVLKQLDLAQAFNAPAELLQYRDQNLQLYFETPNPAGTDSTRFYLDNIDLEICNIAPTPVSFNTKVAGEIRVLVDGVPKAKPGVSVWIYALEGDMQQTYTIQDASFSFYDLPAAPGGTTYILYAQYETGYAVYSNWTLLLLRPGAVIDDIAMLLF